jgi:Protein of unknown function (DUF2849)
MSAEPQMVTANRLIDGVVVYLTADSKWSENFVDGAVWPDKASADNALVASEEAVKARLVVGPYLFEVAVTDSGPQPVGARERIRATHLPTFEPEVGSWTGRISD